MNGSEMQGRMNKEAISTSGSGTEGVQERRRRLSMWLFVAGVALVFVIVGSWVLTSERVLPVIGGEVLRSRQLEPEELQKVIEDEHLRTVISLRAEDPDLQWLKDERKVCSDLGVSHAALTFSPQDWPARHQVRRLVALLQSAEPPILLHCFRGVDRSGWAATVALLLVGEPLDDAMIQLSPRYGHICDRDACPLHFFFESYRQHLNENALAGTGDDFRIWVTEDYCPEPFNAGLEVLTELPAQAVSGESVRASVRAVNQGSFSWRMTDLETTGVRLGARMLGPFEQVPDDPIQLFRSTANTAVDLARSGLESGVMAQGAQRDFELRFTAPKQPGIYLLQIDMVDELVHWFSDLGFPGIIHEITIAESGSTE